MHFASETSEILRFSIWASLGVSFCLVAFMAIRRVYRRWLLRRRDRTFQWVREHWDRILNGELKPSSWLSQAWTCEVVEHVALDAMDAADECGRAALRIFFRESGLLERVLHQARHGKGQELLGAIHKLGRMRAVEAVPLIGEQLTRWGTDVTAAVRALGCIGTIEAGKAIIERMEQQLICSRTVLESALFQCYAGHGPALARQLAAAPPACRPLLARVLAEVVMPGDVVDTDVLSRDPDPDLRASAARILSATRPRDAAPLLCILAEDAEWVVRLRAMVALGDLADSYTVPTLVRGLCDRNRMVRLRAAAALTRLPGEEERVLRLAHSTGDHYALQSLVSEFDRAGKLTRIAAKAGDSLLQIIACGGGLRTASEAARARGKDGQALVELAAALAAESRLPAQAAGESV